MSEWLGLLYLSLAVLARAFSAGVGGTIAIKRGLTGAKLVTPHYLSEILGISPVA